MVGADQGVLTSDFSADRLRQREVLLLDRFDCGKVFDPNRLDGVAQHDDALVDDGRLKDPRVMDRNRWYGLGRGNNRLGFSNDWWNQFVHHRSLWLRNNLGYPRYLRSRDWSEGCLDLSHRFVDPNIGHGREGFNLVQGHVDDVDDVGHGHWRLRRLDSGRCIDRQWRGQRGSWRGGGQHRR